MQLPPPIYLTANLPGTGGLIKQQLDDFQVEEVPAYPFEGTGTHCYLKAQRVSGSGAITYKWKFGATTASYSSITSASTNISSDAEVYNVPGSTTAQIINLGEVHTGNVLSSGGQYNTAAAENTANAVTISVTFNGASTEQIKGVTFKCMAEQ